MLSKLFSSARKLLNSSPQAVIDDQISNSVETEEMVTTRGQSRPASPNGDTIEVDIPRISRKRSRRSRDESEIIVVDEDLAMSVKKQKILPVRKKDEALNQKTRVVVEIPVSKMARELKTLDGSAKAIGFEEEEEEEEEGDDSAAEKGNESEAIAWDELGLESSDSGNDSEVAEEPTKPARTSSSRQSKPAKSPRLPALPVLAQPKHKRFGSEEPEPEPEIFSTAIEIQDSEEASSDDDAPEFIGAQDALDTTQSKLRQAAKAVEEQEIASRKQRQEREIKLKEQAEAAARKRERAERKMAKMEAKRLKRDQDESEDVMMYEHGDEDKVAVAKKTILTSSSLPNLLPDEYLQDDEDANSLIDLDMDLSEVKPKKMKFSDLAEKKPKDRKIGSTTYRVAESRNRLLAPKASFQAKRVKESWLKGRGAMGGGVRKVASTGFFKKC